MKTASRLSQSELMEVMALQVRADEKKARPAALAEEEERADAESTE